MLILDNLPEKAKKIDIEALMDNKKLKFQKIEFLSLEESVQFPGTGLKTQSSKIFFDSKSDLSKCAHEIVNKQSFKLFSGKTQKIRHVL